MTRRRFIFDPPDRFVAGTIGLPGQRTFLLQAREGRRIVSVVLEKAQVAVLADRLGQLLSDLEDGGLSLAGGAMTGSAGEGSGASGDVAPRGELGAWASAGAWATAGGPGPGAGDEGQLDEPLNEAFRAAALTLGWDPGAQRVLIEARAEAAQTEEELAALLDDEDEDGPDVFRVRLTPVAARAFVDRAFAVVNAGRPPCPLCGQPLDPQGHLCPRRNGQYLH